MPVRTPARPRRKRTTTMKVSSPLAAALRHMAAAGGTSVTSLLERAILDRLAASGRDPGAPLERMHGRRGRPSPDMAEARRRIAAQPLDGTVALPARLTAGTGDCLDAAARAEGRGLRDIAEDALRVLVLREGSPVELDLAGVNGEAARRSRLASLRPASGRRYPGLAPGHAPVA